MQVNDSLAEGMRKMDVHPLTGSQGGDSHIPLPLFRVCLGISGDNTALPTLIFCDIIKYVTKQLTGIICLILKNNLLKPGIQVLVEQKCYKSLV